MPRQTGERKLSRAGLRSKDQDAGAPPACTKSNEGDDRREMDSRIRWIRAITRPRVWRRGLTKYDKSRQVKFRARQEKDNLSEGGLSNWAVHWATASPLWPCSKYHQTTLRRWDLECACSKRWDAQSSFRSGPSGKPRGRAESSHFGGSIQTSNLNTCTFGPCIRA